MSLGWSLTNHRVRVPVLLSSLPPSSIRFTSTMSRNYSEALRLLSQLQSNRQTTRLFEKPPASSAPPQDLNAAALPEMRSWLRRAGYSPQDLSPLRHIHVAGTKGKGSVCAYATGMLQKYGKVGTYTSPHLVSVRERIAIDGEPVSQEVFAKSFFELWERFSDAARREGSDAVEAEGPGTKPFFFRFLTILAWHIFLSEKVGSVVLECGIGGEYDATNVLLPEAVSAAVVTQLGIDHVAMLGDTVEQISWHKAGIFKPGVRGFTRKADEKPGVMAVLRNRAAEKGAELVELNDELVERWGGVKGRLAGDFQKYNQALAVLAVREHLGMDSDPTTAYQDLPDEMIAGLREAKLRGRCEIIQNEQVGWHLDGAHTKDSLGQVAKWFAQTLDATESALLVFNQQSERDATELLAGFLNQVQLASGRTDVFSHALFTRNDQVKSPDGQTRDLDVQARAAELMSERAPGCQTMTFDNIQETVEEAERIAKGAGGEHKVLVTGSLHLVGGILRALEPESLL
ncbi:hypothetical protein G7046_g4773 [Stylonectria norvegica]|nr:hypothetical protein G7046_g4773 [Stylonectria norvegica]